jgi:O-antigen/teichoic acid export membrane protein
LNPSTSPTTPRPPGGISTGFSRQVSLNSFSGGLRFVVLTGIYFLTYPYMLHSLGPQRFGLWALGLAVSQWIVAGDLGIAGTLMKFVPEHWNNRNIGRINQLASAGFVILAMVGLTFMVSVWLLRYRLLSLLRVPSAYQPEMLLLIWGMPCVFFLNLLATGLTSVLNGIQRVDVSNIIYSGIMGLYGVGVFFVLSRHYGLTGLMLNAGLAAVLWIVVSIYALKHLVPGFRFEPGRIGRSDIRDLLRFGAYLQGAMIAAALAIPTTRVLLSRYVSLSAVSYFELASGMALQARSFFNMTMVPLIPAASHLGSQRAGEKIFTLYRLSFRFLMFLVFPAGLLIAALAPSFTRIWLGSEIPHVAYTLGLLSLAWMANALSIPAYFIVQGLGFPKYQMYCQLLYESVVLVLGSVLVRGFGYYGAVAGLMAGLVAAAAYIIYRFHQLTKYSFRGLWDSAILKVSLINLILFLPAWTLLRGREMPNLFSLAVASGLYVTIYLVLIIALRCISEREWRIARDLLPPGFLRIAFNRVPLSK